MDGLAVSVQTIAFKFVMKQLIPLNQTVWSERLTSRWSGWLGAAVVGLIPCLASFIILKMSACLSMCSCVRACAWVSVRMR